MRIKQADFIIDIEYKGRRVFWAESNLHRKMTTDQIHPVLGQIDKLSADEMHWLAMMAEAVAYWAYGCEINMRERAKHAGASPGQAQGEVQASREDLPGGEGADLSARNEDEPAS